MNTVVALPLSMMCGYLMGIILMVPIKGIHLRKWRLVLHCIAISLLCLNALTLVSYYLWDQIAIGLLIAGLFLGIYQFWRKEQKTESDYLNHGIDRNPAKGSAIHFLVSLGVCWAVCFLLLNLWALILFVPFG